jgi:hypothetical protein
MPLILQPSALKYHANIQKKYHSMQLAQQQNTYNFKMNKKRSLK